MVMKRNHESSPSSSSITSTAIVLVGINKEIAKCADRKDFSGALELFKNAKGKNAHTFAAFLNVCVRCGEMSTAVATFNEMVLDDNVRLDLVSCTTLMKGYCLEGDIINSNRLLNLMSAIRPHPVIPNIRTINTYLRGCVLIGDVVNGLDMLMKITQNHVYRGVNPDESTWEYVITLMSQALLLDRAFPVVGRLKQPTEGGDSGGCVGWSGLIAIYISLARASALLGQWKSCQKFITQANNALVKLDEDEINKQLEGIDDTETGESKKKQRLTDQKVVGGKRAWKDSKGNEEGEDSNAARLKSLEVYLQHRKDEQMRELNSLKDFVAGNRNPGNHSAFDSVMSKARLLLSYMKFIMYPPPLLDAVVDIPSKELVELDKKKQKSLKLSKHSSEVVEPIGVLNSLKYVQQLGLDNVLNEISNAIITSGSSIEKEASAIKSKLQGSFDTYIQNLHNSEGFVDFATLFSSEYLIKKEISDLLKLSTSDNYESSTEFVGKPIKLEICSGTGEWIVEQAKIDLDSHWVALELRFDRSYQTLTRAYFEGVRNLSVIRGDANFVLQSRITPGTISQICINHPEPPQQRGSVDSEGKHLLTKEFFIELSKILLPSSKTNHPVLTIVTDNFWYSRYLMRILCNNASEIPFRTKSELVDQHKLSEKCGDISIFTGFPGADGGHMTSASSYFDRLWQKEQLNERYCFILEKCRLRDRANIKFEFEKSVSKPVKATSSPAVSSEPLRINKGSAGRLTELRNASDIVVCASSNKKITFDDE